MEKKKRVSLKEFLRNFFGGDAPIGIVITLILWTMPITVGPEGFFAWVVAIPLTAPHVYFSLNPTD